MPLYVTVTPTLTVADDTVLDPAALNQLGTPTVHIQGTLDGTSALSIGAGSVTNAMLENMDANTVKGRDESAGVPVNLTMHSSMDIVSGALKVKDGGVTTTQLASAATTAAGAIGDVNIATGIIGPNKLKAQVALSLLGNGGDTAAAAPEPILVGTGLTVTNADEIATATRARTSNVAIITTGSAHSYAVGDKINVTGLGGTGYTAYGATTLTGTTGSTIKYASVGDDEASAGSPTTDAGGKVRRIENAGTPTSTISVPSFIKAFCTFNGGVSSGGVNLNTLTYTWSGTASPRTVTSSSAHGLATGEIVKVLTSSGGAGGVALIPWTVTVLTSTTFSILSSGASSSGTLTLGPYIKSGGYNVSTVTRNSIGDYSLALTDSISQDSNGSFCVQITTNEALANDIRAGGSLYGTGDSWLTNSTIRVLTGNRSSGAVDDLRSICVAVFGNP